MGLWLSIGKKVAKSGARKLSQAERDWLDKAGFNDNGWHNLNLFGYKIDAKIYDTDSGMGYGVFNKGRVSKLGIFDQKGNELFRWDRHLIESHLPDSIVRTIVATLEHMF